MDSGSKHSRRLADAAAADASKGGAEAVVVKVLLVGAPRAGKTSIVRRLLDKPFRESYRPTRAFDISHLPLGRHRIPAAAAAGGTAGSTVDAPLLVELWDVGGAQLAAAPRHHALLACGAAAALFVCDAASAASLGAVDAWCAALAPYLPPTAARVLVAHKIDLPRCVLEKAALDGYVRAAGFRDWCATVGAARFGDYAVGGARASVAGGGGGGASGGDTSGGGGGGSTAEARRRALSARQLTVQEALRRAVDAGLAAADAADAAAAAAPAPLPVEEGVLGGGSDLTALLWEGCEGEGARAALAALAWQRRFGAADVLRHCSQQAVSSDSGWACYAGGISREAADALLAGEPAGTYLLRRRSPRQLVLCVASGAAARPAQHVLINYEQGHYVDQAGKLGRFPTLEDLFSSPKAARVATRALRFRRVHGAARYERIGDDSDGDGDGGDRVGSGGRRRGGGGGAAADWLPRGRVSLEGGRAPRPGAAAEGEEGRLTALSHAADGMVRAADARARAAGARCPPCARAAQRLATAVRAQHAEWEAQLSACRLKLQQSRPQRAPAHAVGSGGGGAGALHRRAASGGSAVFRGSSGGAMSCADAPPLYGGGGVASAAAAAIDDEPVDWLAVLDGAPGGGGGGGGGGAPLSSGSAASPGDGAFGGCGGGGVDVAALEARLCELRAEWSDAITQLEQCT